MLLCRPAMAINGAGFTESKIDPPASLSKSSKTDFSDPRKKSRKGILNEKNADDYLIDDQEVSYLALQLINVAESKLGSNYHSGGTGDSGFDCSGLMYSTFKRFDITLPRSSNEMAKIGRRVDDSDIKKGDLIFFRTNGKSVINHVGMVVEVLGDEIKFVHSSTHEGVVVSSTNEPYYRRTFAQVNRVVTN